LDLARQTGAKEPETEIMTYFDQGDMNQDGWLNRDEFFKLYEMIG
jgi:hypothetical protein